MNNIIDKSDYIIYVDESGDHGLQNIDKDYPIFVLAFCCFKKESYINKVVPLVQNFKFKYWGHDQIVLHEHPIRKQKDEFAFLRGDAKYRTIFLNDINDIMSDLDCKIFYVVIDKTTLSDRYVKPYNPYDLSVYFGLELINEFLLSKEQEGKEVHFIFEKRGHKEDKELELSFRQICDNHTRFGYKVTDFTKIKFTPIFSDKKSNSTGLQIADLIARPIGLHYIRGEQENRAYKIIEDKIQAFKCFP